MLLAIEDVAILTTAPLLLDAIEQHLLRALLLGALRCPGDARPHFDRADVLILEGILSKLNALCVPLAPAIEGDQDE